MPATLHFRNSITLQVRVPVLSEKIYFTWNTATATIHCAAPYPKVCSVCAALQWSAHWTVGVKILGRAEIVKISAPSAYLPDIMSISTLHSEWKIRGWRLATGPHMKWLRKMKVLTFQTLGCLKGLFSVFTSDLWLILCIMTVIHSFIRPKNFKSSPSRLLLRSAPDPNLVKTFRL